MQHKLLAHLVAGALTFAGLAGNALANTATPVPPFAFKPTSNPCQDVEVLGKMAGDLQNRSNATQNPAEKQQLQQQIQMANGIGGQAKAACERSKQQQPGKPPVPNAPQQPNATPGQPIPPFSFKPTPNPCADAEHLGKMIGDMQNRSNATQNPAEKQQLQQQLQQANGIAGQAKAACERQPGQQKPGQPGSAPGQPPIPPFSFQPSGNACADVNQLGNMIGSMQNRFNNSSNPAEKQALQQQIAQANNIAGQAKAACERQRPGQPAAGPVPPFSFKPTGNPCNDVNSLNSIIAGIESQLLSPATPPANKGPLMQQRNQAAQMASSAKAACAKK